MMKMRIISLSLLAMMTIAMQAQIKAVNMGKATANTNVKVLTNPHAIWMPKPEATVDKKTKKKVAVWGDTENNSWHENIGMVENVPVVKDFEAKFPEYATIPANSPYVPMPWQLTEEGGETVLHCYFRMPADIVKNLWLASNETAILDKETGTLYRSRRTVPACFGKVFSVKASEGTVLDFQIYFPKLAETTKEIAIYGVPNWYLRGLDITLNKGLTSRSKAIGYDEKPVFHKPHLVSEANDYNKDNYKSWAVYDDAHLIKPVKDGTYAMWITPEATYLAEACEMNWNREYFGRGGDNILVDQAGHQYKCREVLDYPFSNLFWNEGLSGDYFAIVSVFDPIPLNIENVTLIVPEGEPFAMWGANWSGKVETFNIKDLRQNQHLFEYHPREVIK